MSAITIQLSDDQLAQLREIAARLKVTPEELVFASVGELLSRGDAAFADAAAYVVRKNLDLYKRLA